MGPDNSSRGGQTANSFSARRASHEKGWAENISRFAVNATVGLFETEEGNKRFEPFHDASRLFDQIGSNIHGVSNVEQKAIADERDVALRTDQAERARKEREEAIQRQQANLQSRNSTGVRGGEEGDRRGSIQSGVGDQQEWLDDAGTRRGVSGRGVSVVSLSPREHESDGDLMRSHPLGQRGGSNYLIPDESQNQRTHLVENLISKTRQDYNRSDEDAELARRRSRQQLLDEQQRLLEQSFKVERQLDQLNSTRQDLNSQLKQSSENERTSGKHSVAGYPTSSEDNLKFSEYSKMTKRSNSGGLSLNEPPKDSSEREKPLIIGGTRVDKTASVDYDDKNGKGRIYIKSEDYLDFKNKDKDSLLDLFAKRAPCSSIRVHRPTNENDGKTIEITTKGSFHKDLSSVTVHLKDGFHAKLEFHEYNGEYALNPDSITYFKEKADKLVPINSKENKQEFRNAQNLLGAGGCKIKVTNISANPENQDQFTQFGTRDYFQSKPWNNAPKVKQFKANSIFLDTSSLKTDVNDGKTRYKIADSDRKFNKQDIYLVTDRSGKSSIEYGKPADWSNPSEWNVFGRSGFLYDPNLGKVAPDSIGGSEGAKIQALKAGKNYFSTTNFLKYFQPDPSKSHHFDITINSPKKGDSSTESIVTEQRVQKRASWKPGGWGQNILKDNWQTRIRAEPSSGGIEGRS